MASNFQTVTGTDLGDYLKSPKRWVSLTRTEITEEGPKVYGRVEELKHSQAYPRQGLPHPPPGAKLKVKIEIDIVIY